MQRNILLVTIDTLRADGLSCYNNQAIATPTIDQVAKEGIRFTNCITNGDHTKVAFPGLLTSTYGSMYTGCTTQLSPQRPYLPELLRQSGYTTAAVVTSPLLGTEYSYDRGFNTFTQLEPAPIGAQWYNRKGAQRALQSPLTHHLTRFLKIDTRLTPLYADAEEATDRALHILGNSHQPQFLWVHYMDVHWPYHREKEIVQPAELARSWRDLAVVHNARHVKPDDSDLERFRKLYLQAIQYVDQQIGRLLEAIAPMADDYIIAIASDHGEGFWEHGRLGHFSHHMYQEIIHVPLILRGPGIEGGATSSVPVKLMDVTPTLLDMAGVNIPDKMLGHSLQPIWETGTAPARDHLISEVVGTRLIWTAVIKGQYKLIWSPLNSNSQELYDLAGDPLEQNNLHGQLPQIERDLLTIAEQHAAFVASSHTDDQGESVELSDAVQERLMALGYIE